VKAQSITAAKRNWLDCGSKKYYFTFEVRILEEGLLFKRANFFLP
jgi:hypothetical protein